MRAPSQGEQLTHDPDSPVPAERLSEFLRRRGWFQGAYIRDGEVYQALVTSVDSDVCPDQRELERVREPGRRAALVRKDGHGVVMLIKGEHVTDADLAAVDDVTGLVERMRLFKKFM